MTSTSFASPSLIGFGTYRLKGNDIRGPLREAIRAGYRHIDTAGIYKNEVEIGEVLQELQKEGVVRRNELYITSKLSPYDMREPQKALERTLENLQTSYLDQYLIHWPGCSGKPLGSPVHAKLRKRAWGIIAAAHAASIIRCIGVSNYTGIHLREMLVDSDISMPFPHVLQMEFHPQYWQEAMALREEFAQQKLQIEGYAVLGEGQFAVQSSVFPEVQHISNRLGATPAQVILAWALRKGVRALVMSRDPKHLAENLAAKSLSLQMTADDDMVIDALGLGDNAKKICWDPAAVV